MNDEQRTPDERITAAAHELYNAPPETPREEIWAAIEARLDSSEAGKASVQVATVPDGAADRVPPLRSGRIPGSRHGPRRRVAWWIGIAAALVIGLGIGRLSMRTGPAEVRVASDPVAETAAETTTAENPAPSGPETVAGSADRAEAEATAQIPEEERADAADRVAAGDIATPAPTAGGQEPDDASAGRRRATGLQYAATTRRLLDRGESFLATVQADLASGAPDPEMETWARSLLSRTRVLMSSPGARDPETRRLLQDLELMLAQIVVTTATGDPGEARILGEGLEDGNLLYRLRSAMEEDDGPGGFRAPRTSSL